MPRKKTPSATIHGEYSALGYSVFETSIKGVKEIHSAGNAIGDSYLIVPPERGVGLLELRQFCINTARSMAEERGAKYVGVERVPEGDVESIKG
jgi:hypothetical protein